MISEATESKFENLKQIMNSETLLDAKRAEALINDLKLDFLQFQLLTPKESELLPQNIMMFRDILEYDALFSIKTKNLDEFERAMAQLKCYYFRKTDLPPSDNMPLLLAIHLVAILGKKDEETKEETETDEERDKDADDDDDNEINRAKKKKLVDFNIELQLAREIIGHNIFLDYAADLHQSVIENSFARLFILENQPPSPLFNQFTADLLNGARNSHADSIERAYKYLTLSEISSILHFNNEEDVRLFVSKRKWRIADDDITVIFNREEGKSKSSEDMLRRAIALSEQISTLA
ncbi:hypothetical protein M9Y10_043190 [Tritrichomonas musculus]|uniref:PCI domain-containing protein n=1 Tax=Tritrichomonas musculus TaxID=1915356 RepID=A0ABR2JYZ5_9EUKA